MDKTAQKKKKKKRKRKEKKRKNSEFTLSGTFDVDLEEYLDKSLLFNLKKTSEEKIFDAILEKIPNSDTYYIKYREGTNAFHIRKDEKQVVKDEIIKLIKTIESEIKKSTNK